MNKEMELSNITFGKFTSGQLELELRADSKVSLLNNVK